MSITTNLFQAVRAHYGLTQEGLAGYLGVARPQLALAETAGRELSVAAMLRLLPFTADLPPPWGPAPPDDDLPADEEHLPPAAPDPAPGTAPPADRALRRRYLACLLEATRRARALRPQIRRTAQARRLLALLPTLAAATPPANERATRWLATFEAEARAHWAPEATTGRVLLAARLAASRHEAALLAAWRPPAGPPAP